MLDNQLVEVNLKDFTYKKHIVEAVKTGYHHKETESYKIQRQLALAQRLSVK